MSGKWAKPALICGAAILLLALGVWLSGDSLPVFIRRLFTLSYLPQLSPGVSLFTVALFGFLTSFHCIGMCGGTVLALSEDQPTALSKGLLFQGGRILSCVVIGAALGLLGSALKRNPYLDALLPLICGIVLILMGLRMLGLFRWLGGRDGGGSSPVMERLRNQGAFALGLLTGCLPCGMLQAVQLHALSRGSLLMGALTMLVFAVASAPVLFSFGMLAGALNPRHHRWINIISALLVIYMGLNMLRKAINLLGAIL